MREPLSSGYWYAVLSSRELDQKPLKKVRFGVQLVFWRDENRRVVCQSDQCPHRGAALSLGKVKNGTISCKYHGFCFDASGRCIKVPAEENWTIPDDLSLKTYQTREEGDYIWLWRGPKVDSSDLPEAPHQDLPEKTIFGEFSQIWPAHYTRCIEGVVDYSHLPFVHTKTLGLFRRNPVTRVEVSSIKDGFKTSLIEDQNERHFVNLTFPNIWTQPLGDNYAMSVMFAPIDDSHTEVYQRWHHKFRFPLLRPFINLWGRFSVYFVFSEDMKVLDSQRPRSADDASTEKLVPSDAAIIAYRRMRRKHQFSSLNEDNKL
jgi:phenylpropionate dioxygenase-like ring-hydroxylating dioxygenase large terminal subunit